jgi:hypothetical protein
MADEKLRLVSLSVRGGPLHGRRHDPDEVVTEILIGSDPDCHLVVDQPGVSPLHARVWADLDESIVYDTHAPRGLYVNATRVEKQAPIGPGDVLWLGPPQDSGSVCIECRFEPWVEVLPASFFGATREAPASPAGPPVTPAGPPTAPAEAPTPSPEEDPFFVAAGPGAGFVPSSASPPVLEEPVPAEEEPAAAGAPPVVPRPVELTPALSPEALVAETVADDWVIAEPEPVAPVAPPAASPARPPAEPAAAPPADEFFVGEESAAPAAGAVVSVGPIVEPAKAQPLPSPAADRAPLPPTVAPAAPPPGRAGAPAPERARVEPKPAAPPPRPEPTPVRRPAPSGAARPAPSRRPAPPARRPARRASPGAPGWIRPVGLGAAGALVLAALAFLTFRLLGGGVRLEGVEPARLRVGQRATLTGSGFAADPRGNQVLFDNRQAKVVRASATRLEVEVPEVVAESGAERRVGVVVRRGRRTSGLLDVAVFQGPRLHGISPEAALPGEEVLLAGAGWGPGATVRFGGAEAQINEADGTRIRAIVPEGAGGPGTAAPVVVTVGGVDSNPAPFIVGHLPVVSAVSPASAAPGDVVSVSGRGFHADPLANDVRVDGVPALVASASGDALRVVMPRIGPGGVSRALEVRVPGSENVGQTILQVAAPADPVEFHFVAEPFVAVPGRPHAILATGLGPAFVLAASGGQTAASRAVDAAARLNGAASALRTTLGLNVEARGLESSPTLGLAGHPEALLEVTAEDAAAYDEDWTGLRGRGGPVTRARLARWWEAVGRDIVLLTVRGERPHFAAALAPEGRVLGQLFDAAQRSGRPGVPRQVVNEARPPLRDGLRLLALRVPASVAAVAPPTIPAVTATPPPARLELEGAWGGSQTEQGQRQYLTVTFRRGGGSISYEGGITLTIPLLSLDQPRRDQVHFSVQIRGGVRHYVGKWDGETLSGSISTDAASRNVVASFELRRR